MTRSELAKLSGLSVPTVSGIVSDLLADGYLDTERMPATRNRSGPRASALTLAADGHHVVGVYVGCDRLLVGTCDLRGVLVHADAVPLDRAMPAETVLGIAARRVRDELARAMRDGRDVLGVGVAVPGPVDPSGRRSLLTVDPRWRGLAVADRLEQALGTPVVIEYNAQAIALAEARRRDAEDAEDLLYLHVGHSLGTGSVVGGASSRRGTHGVAELGHLRVCDTGPRCEYGAVGCLSALVCAPYLQARMEAAAKESPVLADAAKAAEDTSCAAPLTALQRAAEAGDPAAGGILAEYVDHLSTGLAAAMNLLSPARIVLGGMLADGEPALFGRIQAATRDKVFPLMADRTVVERLALGRDAGVIGAAAVALDRLFYTTARPAEMTVPIPTR